MKIPLVMAANVCAKIAKRRKGEQDGATFWHECNLIQSTCLLGVCVFKIAIQIVTQFAYVCC